ncbi:MAG TPA: ABC transporter permease [Xanthobacteraceae bacterium]|jgi:cell division transport system permease protein|nr:ABC transporter permease [Xanthobacteraceae bacterium]
MTDTDMTDPGEDATSTASDMRGETVPPSPRSIVPADTIAGRSLVAVIAIMTFLAALTLGAVVLIHATATEWQSEVAREVTIQVRPAPGRDIEADVKTAAGIAAAQPGVAGVRPYSKAETARLLEPWLGTGLTLDDLPVPRLIVVRIASDNAPDLAQLAKAVTAQVPGATLDDHRGWVDRMRSMARTAVAIGIGLTVLVLVATVLSVTFATGGAMAANRPIIEVLHFVGAKDGFIAGQFQRHFLLLGLTGGVIGGMAAMLLFLAAGFLGDRFKGTAAQDQVAALFGSLSIGVTGYAAIVGLVVTIAVVTAGASRLTVYRTLGSIE